MINKIKKHLFGNKNFIKNSAIVFFGGMAVNVLNYVFNLIAGRYLGPVDYGILVALVSLITLLLIPAQSINIVTVKLTSGAFAKNKLGEIKSIFYKLIKFTAVFSFVVIALILIFSQFLANFLNIDVKYIIIFSIFILLGYLFSISRGLMQGMKRFKAYSISTISEIALKIIIFIISYSLGLRVTGALLAFIVAAFITYLFSFIPIKDVFKAKIENAHIKKLFSYSSYTFFSFAILTFLTFIDVILVKHYFSSYDAGNYAALANIGKIIFYVAAPITAVVMFPMVSEAHEKNKRHFSILLQTFILTILICSPILIIFYFYPEMVVKILFGAKYILIYPFIFSFGLAMFILSLCNVFIYYFLSIKKLNFLPYIIIILCLEITLIIFYHQDIGHIINNLIYSFGLLFLLLSSIYLFDKKKQLSSILLKK